MIAIYLLFVSLLVFCLFLLLFVSMFIFLFGNYSQRLGLKDPIFQSLRGGGGSHLGDVIRKFGEDWSKTLPMGPFFHNILVGVTNLCLNLPPTQLTTNHYCVNPLSEVSKTMPKSFAFSFPFCFFLSPRRPKQVSGM